MCAPGLAQAGLPCAGLVTTTMLLYAVEDAERDWAAAVRRPEACIGAVLAGAHVKSCTVTPHGGQTGAPAPYHAILLKWLMIKEAL